MKRRFMMWMTIVCILVVGVSVTRMTRKFVVSQGVDAAAIVNIVDAEEQMPAAMAGGVMAPETEAELETVAEKASKTSLTEETAEVEDGGVPETVAAQMADAVLKEEAPAEALSDFVSASPKAPIDTTKNEAIQETVKSPLDPVVVTETVIDVTEESVSYHAEDFFERFAMAEQSALQLWDNVTADNRPAYLAAAEQERILWDHELNQVYQVIRGRLSKEEMEALKVLEVEWIKERDLYAEKAIAKSSMKNAQNQNPDYTRALTEKTKERCYWLVSEYEDVLNRE